MHFEFYKYIGLKRYIFKFYRHVDLNMWAYKLYKYIGQKTIFFPL